MKKLAFSMLNIAGSCGPRSLAYGHFSIPATSRCVVVAGDWSSRRRLATSAATRAAPLRNLDDVRSRRNQLFEAEMQRQRDSASSRLKKIRIVVESEGEDEANVEMWMNQDLSTPRDCAMHLNTHLVRRRLEFNEWTLDKLLILFAC